MTGREHKADTRTAHHQFWQVNLGAGITSVFMIDGNLTTGPAATVNPCLPRAAKLARCGIHCLTLGDTVPGNWTMRIRKNEAGADSATFSFAVAVGGGAKTAGIWSADVVWQAGETYHLLADGPAKNGIAIRCYIEWEVL